MNTLVNEVAKLDSEKRGNGFEMHLNSNFPICEGLNHKLEFALVGGDEIEEALQNAAEMC